MSCQNYLSSWSYCLPSLLGVGEEYKSIPVAHGLDINCPALVVLGESRLQSCKLMSWTNPGSVAQLIHPPNWLVTINAVQWRSSIPESVLALAVAGW